MANPNHRDVTVGMTRSRPPLENQLALYAVVKKATERLGFDNYSHFMNGVLTLASAAGGKPVADETPLSDLLNKIKAADAGDRKETLKLPTGLSTYSGTRSYNLMKDATEVFVQSQSGVWPRGGLAAYSKAYAEASKGGRFDKDAFAKAVGTSLFDDDDAEDVQRRLERPGEISAGDLSIFWAKYLQKVEGDVPDTTPYLYLIAQKLGIGLNDESMKHCARCCNILSEKLINPCLIELIWSYWMEQGMVVQSINALAMRFQNVRTSDRDVLARFDLDPLRPINNLLWGYIQDEINRLTVVRRAYEYDHHYGLRLNGPAIPAQMRFADSRTKFLEGFHNLLRECARYYRAITNTFVVPDTYSALNSLKELQLILTEGMHNQYGDLPSTSRVEMLTQMSIMARPEMLQFVGGRTMVPYAEPWMMYVDSIRQMHGWGDTGIRHYRDLAIFGEKILLAVRFGDWADNQNETAAALFMSLFREEVQAYIHAYRAVTGIDLGVMDDVRPVDSRLLAAQPADLIARRTAAAAAPSSNGRYHPPRMPAR